MIAIVDYGVGNLFSLLSSLKALGLEAEVTGDAGRLRAADRIILPGVGAFGDARAKLDATGLVPVIREEAEKKPLLGICLGMQLLFDKSFEYGEHPGLGLVPGQVVDLRRDLTDKTLKVPHMGWNSPQLLCPGLRRQHSGRIPVWQCGRHRRGAPGKRLRHPVPSGEIRRHGTAAAAGFRGTVRRVEYATYETTGQGRHGPGEDPGGHRRV